VLFAAGHSVTAGIVTLVVFLVYTQIENHLLNPVIMSRTMKISPLLVLLAVLAGYSVGSWIGGLFGGFVAVLLAVPSAGAVQIVGREAWRATARQRRTRINDTDRDDEGVSGMDGHPAASPGEADAA
jgi:predicted PurR-regulated permease PerM